MSISTKLRSGILMIASIFLISFHSNVQGQDSTATVAATALNAELVAAGELLFKNNCLVCHNIHEQKVGPALADVHNRRSVEWIKPFILNSQKVIQSGDDYAVALYNQYNQTVMTSFDFKDEELNSLIEYIKSETIKGPPVKEVVATTAAGAAAPQQSILSKTTLVVLLIVLLVVLIMILVVLFILVSVLTRYLQQKSSLSTEDQEVVFQRFQFGQYIRSPGFIWITTFIFTALVIKTVIDGLFSVGVQQNYAPTQPIAFSHKVHAGDFKIDCNYCHTGVRISKSANIPSVNICLNCHSAILKITGATEISTEIQKIYEAKQSNTPIQWVRVHNLPDLAYFNHAQHFNVGGITCQTCHGAVETMPVLTQNANLTMGWCIDCHRKTEIKVDNGYYERLSELHSKTSKKPMVVEDIGGLECSKCHY
ncbi:MAG: c-type cytochrome [Cyclobacteriaceae bacterium]|nr:c-type cytochrome [Cyclobacteriaceae bacterium]